MDAWFEEDEQVFTHPRDPYTRVDILAQLAARPDRGRRGDGRRVVEADACSSRLACPSRYYLPKTHVRMDLLTPTDTVTHCPYKGEAEYWSLRVGDDTPRRPRVVVPHAAAGEPEDRRAGQLLHEKVDLYVDGVRQA